MALVFIMSHFLPFCMLAGNLQPNINCNTTRQNVVKSRKTCTVLKFDLVHINGPETLTPNLFLTVFTGCLPAICKSISEKSMI